MLTDTSKYAWSTVLTQEYTTSIDGKVVHHKHPVTYVSMLFHGSQLNWTALKKEAFLIYMSVKIPSFYLADAPIIHKSGHLPQKSFFKRQP